jgi:hypothetical protein
MEQQRRRPDFVIPGFARCGTTWLYEVLRRHPGIFLPERKELDFFSESWAKGYPFYAAYFAGARDDQLTGDVSPVYAEHPEVPERLASTAPGARIVIVVRDQVDRLRSSYWQSRRDGWSHAELERFLAGEVEDCAYLVNQRYAPAVETYRRLFGADSVLVLVYEEVSRDPRAGIRAILAHLGLGAGEEELPAAMEELLGKRVNPTFMPKRPGVYRVAQRVNQTLRKAHLPLLDRPLALGKELFFKLSGERQRQELGPMPGEERLRRYFRDDVEALERVLGRPLAGVWRQAVP